MSLRQYYSQTVFFSNDEVANSTVLLDVVDDDSDDLTVPTQPTDHETRCKTLTAAAFCKFPCMFRCSCIFHD